MSRRRLPLFVPIAIAFAVLAAPVAGRAQDGPKKEEQAPPAKAKPKSGGRAPRRPAHDDSDRTYMGRPIAEVMTYMAADWLVRPEREQEERPDDMIESLKLKPGDVVADIGAGVGYTSLRLAKRVGPQGKVLATDIQPQMIRMLKENIRQAGAKNITPILCTANDTKLPDGKVDLAIMVDVYHECSDPATTLKGIRKALKPGGRLILVEFRAEDPDVPIKPEHKMSVDQVKKEIEPQGFTFKESKEFLPWQHVIVFEKRAEPASNRAEGQRAR